MNLVLGLLQFLRSINLTRWILISLILGFVIGVVSPELAHFIQPFRTVFLNGIKCVVAPLIFASIVTGIASAGSAKSLGKTGFRAIVYFEVATTLALAIGLVLANLLSPGKGLNIQPSVEAVNSQLPQVKLTFEGFIEHLLPHSFIDAAARGDVLQIVLFSVIFGMAILLTGDKAKPVLAFCEALNHTMFKFTELVMNLAPIGVGCAIAGTVGEHGWRVMIPMGKLIGSLYFALLVFFLIVLIPALKWAKVKIRPVLNELRPSFLLAFATSSSESAYPSALSALEKIGVPNRIASFVLPLGYSFNLDGSTLYLAMASIFIAQAANIELSVSTQITMMLTFMLTTKGVAAVPRASLVVLSGTLTAFGLPLEGIPLIIGVDTFMDMARTSINLLGNCVATLVLTHWEGESVNPEYRA